MSSYSTSSGSSYARTLDTFRTDDERASPILPDSGEIYISKAAAMNASSSELESERERRCGDTSNAQPTSKTNNPSTAIDVDNPVSTVGYRQELCQQSHDTDQISSLSTTRPQNSVTKSQPTAQASIATAVGTGSHVDNSVGMKRYFQNPTKKPRANLDDSSGSDEEPHISRRYLRRQMEREEELQAEILRWKHEAHCHAAIARQYRCKIKKMRTLAMAAIDRENNIIEMACADHERDTVSDDNILSDEEDKKIANTVAYSYVDNELFLNEE